MKKKLVLIFLMFAFFKIYPQQAIASTGGDAGGSGGSFSYTVGQVAYTTFSSSNGTVMQGVQQAFEVLTLSGEEFTQIALSMSVYPNPTSSIINLKIEELKWENMGYALYNINGKLLDQNQINSSQTSIKMESFPTGIYILKIIENNNLLKSYQIIKK